MVVLIASLENGTYKEGNDDQTEMTVEELTEVMLEGKSESKTREQVSKNYYVEDVSESDLARWKEIQKMYGVK